MEQVAAIFQEQEVASSADEPLSEKHMRLAFPRINSFQTDDGTASITFLKVNMDRDTGGLDYLFRFKMPTGDIEVHATVAITTSFAAADEFAKGGASLWSLDPTEVRKYVEKYAGEHGNSFLVRIFEVPANTSDSTIQILRDKFCMLFLEYWSSYKYSNADETSDSAGFYPDKLQFVPYDLDEKFRMTFLADKGGRRD